ncbi:unnamed protein product [Phytomonas sp. Hart1]|nr:unnamed protein product [Phytomonas sp. Hart1]|eukprot:CCW68681.1 unnamed protein product [Phytomonas sp. isolate Hart1]
MSENSSPFSLVASDLDGTLFDFDCKITDYTKKLIFRLSHEKNIRFVLATGRHWGSTLSTQKDLQQYFERAYADLADSQGGKTLSGKKHGFYVVSSNGGLVHDEDGKIVVEHQLDPAIVKELYQSFALPYTDLKRGVNLTDEEKARQVVVPQAEMPARDGAVENEWDKGEGGLNEDPNEFSIEKVRVSAYTNKEWLITSSFLPEELMVKKFGLLPIVIDFDPEDPSNEGKSVLDSLPLEGINKICFRSADRALLSSFEQELSQRFGDQISIALSSNFCLDVGPGGISKFSALREIAGHLGISVQSMVSFGDSMNDKEMLENVGKGFVMGNAQARLKKLLPHCTVIGNNNEDAVAKKLEEVFNMVETPTTITNINK